MRAIFYIICAVVVTISCQAIIDIIPAIEVPVAAMMLVACALLGDAAGRELAKQSQ